MGDRRCCCGCVEYSDSFNRDDNDLVGPEWIEADEPLEPTYQRIVDNSLEITENWVRYHAPAPDIPVIISVKLLNISEQQKYGVRFCWNIKTDEYLLVTYQSRGAGLQAQILIYEVLSSGTTLIYDSDGPIPGPERCVGLWTSESTGETTDDTIDLYICYNGAAVNVYTQVSGSYGHSWGLVPPSLDGKYVGLEADSSNTLPIRFDNFFFQDHYLHDPTCPECPCLPGDSSPFPDLTLTILLTDNPNGCTTDWTDYDSITLTRVENSLFWTDDGTRFACFEVSNPMGDVVPLYLHIGVGCVGGVWTLSYIRAPYDLGFCFHGPYSAWDKTIYAESTSTDPFIVEFYARNVDTPICARSFDGRDWNNCGGFTIKFILTK